MGSSVVLDIGERVGALVVYTTGALVGTEIEVFPDDGQHRPTHTEVATRWSPGGLISAAVLDGLAAGTYRIRCGTDHDAGRTTIVGGRVTELDWRSSLSGNAAD